MAPRRHIGARHEGQRRDSGQPSNDDAKHDTLPIATARLGEYSYCTDQRDETRHAHQDRASYGDLEVPSVTLNEAGGGSKNECD